MFIKPFRSFLPVPILPASQVQATSYEQHLAYLEWYIDYMAKVLESAETVENKVTSISADSTDTDYPSAKAVYNALQNVQPGGSTGPEILQAYGLGADIASDDVTVPLFSGYDNTDKLTVASNKIKVGAGVTKIKLSGFCNITYTTANNATVYMTVKKGSTNLAGGIVFLPAGSILSGKLVLPDTLIFVAENDELEIHLIGMASGFTSCNAAPYILAEVIE